MYSTATKAEATPKDTRHDRIWKEDGPLAALDVAQSIIMAANEKAKAIEANGHATLVRQMNVISQRVEREIKDALASVITEINSDFELFKSGLEAKALSAVYEITLSLLGKTESNYYSIIIKQLKDALDLNVGSQNIEMFVSSGDYQQVANSLMGDSQHFRGVSLIELKELEPGSFYICFGGTKIAYNLPEQLCAIKNTLLKELGKHHGPI